MQGRRLECDDLSSCGPPLRILIITEDDPIYVIKFFRVFFNEVPISKIDICGISIDEPFHEPLPKTLRRMQAFYGLFGAVRLGLRFIWARMRGDSIAMLAKRHGIPILQTSSVNCPDFVARARALAPDLIVSVAAPEIFRGDLLAVPKIGSINIHSGKLPNFRGMMPTFWQMLKGERNVTMTVHHMAEKLDAGDILATRDFPLHAADSLDRVISGSKEEGARLLIEVLLRIRAGEHETKTLDWEQAQYFSFPTAADVACFRRLGHRLL